MREKLEGRLEELRQEFQTGNTELQELQARANYVRETTLRLSGAIQVLEELLENEGSSAPEETGDLAASRIVRNTAAGGEGGA